MTDLINNLHNHSTPIAIIGVGALFPGSNSVSEFWKNILSEKDLITDIPSTHWLVNDHYDPDPSVPDKTYCKKGAFLSAIDFDPMEFGILPNNISSTDTSQLLALIVAKHVLKDAAQGKFGKVDHERTSVILGVAAGLELLGEMACRLQRPIWVKTLRESGICEDKVQDICDSMATNYTPWKESTFPGLLGNVVSGRIANRFDLGGTNYTADAACASSFSALAASLNELYLGQADMVITGGVDTTNGPFLYTCFSKTPALSRTGDCRPFSDKADGMVLGEGLGMVALKRLEDAEKNGDHIYAVIKGLGTSSDGKGTSVYAPAPEGQAKALRKCYKVAGYNPDTVELVEAHGTGTQIGDGVEFDALKTVFDETDREKRQWCALGSVKSQIGHTKSAAAAAGLIKTVMALHHKVLPPIIKIDKPDPRLDINNSPFYLNTHARPWVRGNSYPRRASVSSFGFGGTNFHITLEEYKSKKRSKKRLRTMPSELVVFSSTNDNELAKLCKKALADLDTKGMLSYLAQSSQDNLDQKGSSKLAIVATDEDDLKKKLDKAVEKILQNNGSAFSLPNGIYYAKDKKPGSIAYIFSGQGSQYIGMGADLATHFDEAIKVWDFADDIVCDNNFKLHDVVFPQPVFSSAESDNQTKRLTRTQWAQPAISTVSIAYLSLLKQLGLKPDCLAGHSLGEVTAMFEAGVFDAESLLKAVRKRGEIMAKAADVSGSMTAVAHPADKIQNILDELKTEVIIANYNSPKQIVLSGPTTAIEKVEKNLVNKKIRFKRLPVATAFHSSLMKSAYESFSNYLKDIAVNKPVLPIYSNAFVIPYPDDENGIKEFLAKQIDHPVHFSKQIDAMYDDGVRTFIEIGPGAVLKSLVHQCLENKDHVAVSLDRKGKDGITNFWHALALMTVNGVEINFSPLWEEFERCPNPTKKSKSKITFPVMGCNYERPYPPLEGEKVLPKPNWQNNQINYDKTSKVKTEKNKMRSNIEKPIKQTFNDKILSKQSADKPENLSIINVSNDYNKLASNYPDNLDTVTKKAVGTNIDNKYKPHLKATNNSFPIGGNGNNYKMLINAYQKIQHQTAETHSTYQQTQAEIHMAFLKNIEASTHTLGKMLTGYLYPDKEPIPLNYGSNELMSITMPDSQIDTSVLSSELKTNQFQEYPSTTPSLGSYDIDRSGVSFPDNSKTLQHPENLTKKENKPPENTPIHSLQNKDFNNLLLEIVSEKTGYPKEILDVNMSLEADLGIDSIKRVEILSAVKDQIPNLPEVDAEAMADITTLKDVLSYIENFPDKQDETSKQKSHDRDNFTAEIPDESSYADDSNSIGRYTLRKVYTPHSGFVMKGLLTDNPVEVTDDKTGVAPALIRKLKQHGVNAFMVDEVSDQAKGVIFLEGLCELSDQDSAIAVNRKAFIAAQKVAGHLSASEGIFVTVQDTGGDFSLSGGDKIRSWLGGLTGLVKTAALEWPNATLKSIDLERGNRAPDDLAEELIRELFTGGPEKEVGLQANGTRISLDTVPEKINHHKHYLNHQSVIVVSGGARGVTAATLIELARNSKPCFVLLGRTNLVKEPEFCLNVENVNKINVALLEDAKSQGHTLTPAKLRSRAKNIIACREIKSTIASLEKAGSKVHYITTDVQDATKVADVLDSVRQELGPITGIIHGAGVLNDKRITEKTLEQFDFVFNTKVKGLISLLSATRKDPLQLICLFSSVAARYGNVGQCDYAMANEVLNKIANNEAASRKGICVVKSLNWGPWDGGMVSPLLKDHFKKIGLSLIPLKTGAAKFVEEINNSSNKTAEVIIGQSLSKGTLIPTVNNGEMSLKLLIDTNSYPYFNSHKIKDVPVVPVVMVLEWFYRAAKLYKPDLTPVNCTDLQVKKGILLEEFNSDKSSLMLNCRQISNKHGAILAMEMPGKNGVPHYTATIKMIEGKIENDRALNNFLPKQLQSWSWSSSEIYNDLLFHGPKFQVIRSLIGVSEKAALATLAGTNEMGWTGDLWNTDVAALDGGLQLALLWGAHTMGKPSLPTKIGSFTRYHTGLVKGPIRCELYGEILESDKTISDILFFNEKKKLIAEMKGVEMHMMPASALT